MAKTAEPVILQPTIQARTELPAFNGVAAGSRATMQVPVLGTYHQIKLYCEHAGAAMTEAVMRAQILDIRLRLNGITVREHTAAELLDLAKFRGWQPQTGFLPLIFAEPAVMELPGVDNRAWGMLGVSSFEVEVNFAATASNPKLRAFAIKDPVSRPLGRIKQVKRFNVPISVAGQNSYDSLQPSGWFKGLHCYTSIISDVEVKLDQVEVAKWISAADSHDDIVNLSAGELIPQPGISHFIFDPRGRYLDGLSFTWGNGTLVRDFRINFNTTAATPFKMLLEVDRTLGG